MLHVRLKLQQRPRGFTGILQDVKVRLPCNVDQLEHVYAVRNNLTIYHSAKVSKAASLIPRITGVKLSNESEIKNTVVVFGKCKHPKASPFCGIKHMHVPRTSCM